MSEHIGTGERLPDGSIRMRLRAEGPAIGDGVLVYREGDPYFAQVLEHLGNPDKGDTFDVRPFPDSW